MSRPRSPRTPSSGLRRRARWAAAAAGAGALAVVGGNVVAAVRLRRRAQEHGHELDHGAVVGEGLGPMLRLLVVGDSAARGYGLTDPKSAFPFQVASRLSAAAGRRVAVASLATDGHTTRDVVDQQLALVRAHRPDALVVSVGVNDAIKRRTADQVRADTEALLAGVRAVAPATAVAFVTCPDLTLAPGFPRPLNRVVGWRCRAVAATQLAVAARLGVAAVGLPRPSREAYGVDGFHPGAEGAAVMADLAVAALVEEQPWTSD